MSENHYDDHAKKEDMKVLHSMGYAQELERSMSAFSNFAISFSIICILSGGINSLAQATSGAGGGAIGIGWIVGCVVSGVFGLAMAQIGSAYPTAGGLYHWGSILGNRFTGWLTAWLNLLGLVTVLGAINVGTWYFVCGAFGFDSANYQNEVIFLAAITGLQALVNHFGIRLTAKLTDLSGYLIFATALALTIGCLVSAPHLEFSRLWTFVNYSGQPADASVWPQSDSLLRVFLLGLLLPIYTITGYDASAHTSEETKRAAHAVPRGIMSSIIWSSLAGWIMLCSFVLMLPSMDEAAQQGWNVFFWGVNTQMNPTFATIIYIAIFLSQWLCGLATVTSASRMIFAFSRDGGLPGSSALASVSKQHRTPVAAIWTASILAVLFVAVTSAPGVSIGGASAYTVVVSCTVIFLFLSFTVPIALGLFAHGTAKWNKMGPWDLGAGLFKLTAVLSILGMALIFYLGVQPPNDMALTITVGFLVLTAIIWFVFENKRFKGPPIGDSIAKRQAEIAAAEAAIGER
jgi:amino acid transporter